MTTDKRTGSQRIADERKRQIEKEGYDAKHDAEHGDGSLALAAALYATPVRLYERDDFAAGVSFRDPWPWENGDGRPYPNRGNVVAPNHTLSAAKRIRQLEKAGALIAAEIDRLLTPEPGEKP